MKEFFEPVLRRWRFGLVWWLLLTGLGGLSLMMLSPAQAARQSQALPVSLRSVLTADYSADRLPAQRPPESLSLVMDVLRDQYVPATDLPGRFATLSSQLKTPVPSVTPALSTAGQAVTHSEALATDLIQTSAPPPLASQPVASPMATSPTVPLNTTTTMPISLTPAAPTAAITLTFGPPLTVTVSGLPTQSNTSDPLTTPTRTPTWTATRTPGPTNAFTPTAPTATAMPTNTYTPGATWTSTPVNMPTFTATPPATTTPILTDTPLPPTATPTWTLTPTPTPGCLQILLLCL